jgi:transposase
MAKEHPRKVISDRIWKQLEAAIKQAKHSQAGAPAGLSEREFLEAVLYLNRVGCPWRDLPRELGSWHAIYMRFRRWEERGVWRRLWKNLQAEHFAEARDLLMDSTTVRAHQHAAGAPEVSEVLCLGSVLFFFGWLRFCQGAVAPSSSPRAAGLWGRAAPIPKA